MSGYQIGTPPQPSSPPPKRGGGLATAALVGALFAVVAGRGCDKEPPPAPKQVPPAPVKVEPEKEREQRFWAAATSMGSYGWGKGDDRAAAEKDALEQCERKRSLRFQSTAFVGAKDCEIRAVADNFNGPPCIALMHNPETYNYEIAVMTGSSIDLPDRVRAFLNSAQGRRFNTRINPSAGVDLRCVDYYGKMSARDAGYELSRPR